MRNDHWEIAECISLAHARIINLDIPNEDDETVTWKDVRRLHDAIEDIAVEIWVNHEGVRQPTIAATEERDDE